MFYSRLWSHSDVFDVNACILEARTSNTVADRNDILLASHRNCSGQDGSELVYNYSLSCSRKHCRWHKKAVHVSDDDQPQTWLTITIDVSRIGQLVENS